MSRYGQVVRNERRGARSSHPNRLPTTRINRHMGRPTRSQRPHLARSPHHLAHPMRPLRPASHPRRMAPRPPPRPPSTPRTHLAHRALADRTRPMLQLSRRDAGQPPATTRPPRPRHRQGTTNMQRLRRPIPEQMARPELLHTRMPRTLPKPAASRTRHPLAHHMDLPRMRRTPATHRQTDGPAAQHPRHQQLSRTRATRRRPDDQRQVPSGAP